MAGASGEGNRRPFRFGVVVTPTPMHTGSALQQTARAAAQFGYSILLAPDNMYSLSPVPSLALATAAAGMMEPFAPVIEALSGR